MEPKADRAPQTADKFVLRLPDGMRATIAERAKGSNRSMNAEIVAILSAALAGRPDVLALPDGVLLDEVIARYGARQVQIVIAPVPATE